MYRVVQWATGNIGLRSLRAVIEHPELELVGLYVHSESKEGVDAGELCGAGPTGVLATRSIDDVLALKPDCVLYMPAQTDVEELVQLLESGANVVTTALVPPDPRVEEACDRGGSTLHHTGSSPGFITEALPIVLTSLERRLDRLTIDEFADLESRNSPELLFDVMGFGREPAAFDANRFAHGAVAFGPSLAALADALGVSLDSVEGSGDVAVARQRVEIAAGVIEAGTVAAQRMIVTGMRDGRPLLQFRANWYCSADIDPAWELGETGWRVQVEGDLPLDVRIRFAVAPEDWGATSPGVTAHRPVNAVPAVCQAEPGIRATGDLPQVIARFSRSPFYR